MMFLGRFFLGQIVPLSVNCRADDQPYAPTNAPVYRVYDNFGLPVVMGKMPPADVGGAVGVFIFNLHLGADFGEGQHSVAIQFEANGEPRLAVQHFEIVPGGDPNGAVVSAYYYERPMSSFIVARLDSNQRMLAKNPRIGT